MNGGWMDGQPCPQGGDREDGPETGNHISGKVRSVWGMISE